MLLIISGTDDGISTFMRTSFFVPPRDLISRILSGSVCVKPVCSVKMDPNTATDTAATMMVCIRFPIHTMSRGAIADFGRLLSITK